MPGRAYGPWKTSRRPFHSLLKKLINKYISPTFTYSTQTSSLFEHQKSTLGICQEKVKRSIIGVKITDRLPNSTLRSIIQTININFNVYVRINVRCNLSRECVFFFILILLHNILGKIKHKGSNTCSKCLLYRNCFAAAPLVKWLSG